MTFSLQIRVCTELTIFLGLILQRTFIFNKIWVAEEEVNGPGTRVSFRNRQFCLIRRKRIND